MTTNIYKNEFKSWYLEAIKNNFPFSETEKVLTIYKTTEDIHNHIHSMMFVDDDDQLNYNLRTLNWMEKSDETVIVFDFNYEFD